MRWPNVAWKQNSRRSARVKMDPETELLTLKCHRPNPNPNHTATKGQRCIKDGAKSKGSSIGWDAVGCTACMCTAGKRMLMGGFSITRYWVSITDRSIQKVSGKGFVWNRCPALLFPMAMLGEPRLLPKGCTHHFFPNMHVFWLFSLLTWVTWTISFCVGSSI